MKQTAKPIPPSLNKTILDTPMALLYKERLLPKTRCLECREMVFPINTSSMKYYNPPKERQNRWITPYYCRVCMSEYDLSINLSDNQNEKTLN